MNRPLKDSHLLIACFPVAIWSACFSPSFDEGYACSRQEECPPEQVCSGHRYCRLPEHVPRPGSASPKPDLANLPLFRITVDTAVQGVGLEGYVITASNGIFRLTWAGYSAFRGSVFTKPGDLVEIHPGCVDGSCRSPLTEELITSAKGDPDRIDYFSFPTDATVSGFDVEVRGDGAFFDLLIGDQRRADRIFFLSPDTVPPNQIVFPTEVPFGLLTGTP